MSYIYEKLYLGDLDDACDSANLSDKKCVSHILTVDCKPLYLSAQMGFVNKYIHALDVEEFDLLSHFDECISFIDDGRGAGGVLVHCYAGQSRSATIVVAYLMARVGMNMQEALHFVKKMRPCIGPNSGFLKQLELFEAMGATVNKCSVHYRQFRLNLFAANVLNFNLEEDKLASCLSSDPSLSHSDEAVYKCRKCRRSLFRESGILTHSTDSKKSFSKKLDKTSKTKISKSKNYEMTGLCSETIYIEPVTWMQSMILKLDGKLTCPNCCTKIGSYTWSGEQCGCGQWITPAFHFQKSKLDYCNMHLLLSRQLVGSLVVSPTSTHSETSDIEIKLHETFVQINVAENTNDASSSVAAAAAEVS